MQTLFNNPFVALFAIIALGLGLGNIKLSGVSLGSSGVLFVALIFGHCHFAIPAGIGTLGLILFIYCVGLSAGPSFFAAFAKQGIAFAKLSIVIVVIASAITVTAAKLFGIPVDLAVGLFAGALTSTPALAAAVDNLKDLGPLVSVGYGVAYPFGVIGVVLFVQLLPKLLGKDLDAGTESPEEARPSDEIHTAFVQVTNPAFVGKTIKECHFIADAHVRIARVLKGRHMEPVKITTVIEDNQVLKLVGTEQNLTVVIDALGRRATIGDDIKQHSQAGKDIADVVVAAQPVFGKTIAELNPLQNYGVTITRVLRNEVTFTPSDNTKLEYFDQLRIVGDPDGIQQFITLIGHRRKALQQTDLLSLTVGMLCGVLLGLMPISIANSPSFSFGLSGGLLIVSLVLGHFGRIGRIVGRVPIASRVVMMELGLIFFLADAGVKAGGSFISIVQTYGIKLFLAGALVTILPMIVAYIAGRTFLKIPMLQVLGGICGGMTSTPALGAIKSKTDSELPVISYAAAYPVALIFLLIFSNLIIFVLQ